tara:strand:+ start:1955 stop:2380 length:426 start_codon:yes stop_codon:yes gene_type:complete
MILYIRARVTLYKEDKVMKKLVLMLSVLSVSACASIVSGDQQVVSVETPDCDGAKCKLSNEQGTYYVSPTPGTVTINKSASPMILECSKGNKKEMSTVESGTEGMAFGNILAGGIIGAAVDMGTGAAYDYPNVMTNPLQCD